MHALLIDDSRALRKIVRGILTELGFEVTEAGHGGEGLARLAEMKSMPDVILVDWNMPEMDGLEFIRAVRANPAYGDLPLMMVTTETEMERMAVALVAGANEYLMKPFDKQAIEDKLQILGIGAA